jgi:hypothetical protein
MRYGTPIPLLVVLVTLLSGCHPGLTVTRLGPPGVNYESVPPDSVFLFRGKDRVLVGYRPIARLETSSIYELGGGEYLDEAEWMLLDKAAKLGAHGIIQEGPTEATAIRFTGGDARDMAADQVADPAGIKAEEKAAVKAAVLAEAAAPVRVDPASRVPAGPEPWRHTLRFPREVKTLFLAPLAVPQDLPVPDSVLAVTAETLYAELEAAGYRLVEEVEVADAVLFPDIEPVEARFVGDRAEWDGVSRKVGETRSTGAKVVSGFLNLLVHGESNRSDEDEPDDPAGWVWAISLVVSMENSIGALLYSGRGGIELLEKADFEGGIYIGDPGPEEYEVEEVAEEQLFTRTGRWRRAVGIALAGLGRGGGGS